MTKMHGILALVAASTALTAVGQVQAGSAAEAQAASQKAIMDAQARDARAIAERNALIVEDTAKFSAERLREQAVQEEAVSQKATKEERRKTELAISAARAKAGGSGAGVYDPTILDIIGGISETGTYDAMTALYEGTASASLLRSKAELTEYEGEREAEMLLYGGETKSSLLEYSGKAALAEGQAAKSQSYLSAGATLTSGAVDAYDISKKYV